MYTVFSLKTWSCLSRGTGVRRTLWIGGRFKSDVPVGALKAVTFQKEMFSSLKK